jgi:hypothetical protein
MKENLPLFAKLETFGWPKLSKSYRECVHYHPVHRELYVCAVRGNRNTLDDGSRFVIGATFRGQTGTQNPRRLIDTTHPRWERALSAAFTECVMRAQTVNDILRAEANKEKVTRDGRMAEMKKSFAEIFGEALAKTHGLCAFVRANYRAGASDALPESVNLAAKIVYGTVSKKKSLKDCAEVLKYLVDKGWLDMEDLRGGQ